MTMFTEGFAEEISLTDEALVGFETESAPEVQAENKEEGEQASAEVRTAEAVRATEADPTQLPTADSAAEDAENTPTEQSETEQKKTTDSHSVEEGLNAEALSKRLKDAQSWGHEQSLRLAEANRRLAELEREYTALKNRPRIENPTPRQEVPGEEALQKLVHDPYGYTNELLAPAIQQAVERAIAPFKQAQEQASKQKLFQAGMQRIVETYGQAADKEAQKQLIEEAVRVCQENGDMETKLLWGASGMVLSEAAQRLWGLPRQVDQASIDEAVRQALAAKAKEDAAREAGKIGLAAQVSGSNAMGKELPSEADRIAEDIMSYARKGLF